MFCSSRYIFIATVFFDVRKGGIIFSPLEVKKLRQRRPGDWPVVPQPASQQSWGETGPSPALFHRNLFCRVVLNYTFVW